MAADKFREEIEEKLLELIKNKQEYKKRIAQFSWRCAMRALPFLGSEGNFNFWNLNSRERNLHTVFYALDASAYFLIKPVLADYNEEDPIDAAGSAFKDEAYSAVYAAYASAYAIRASLSYVYRSAASVAKAAAAAAFYTRYAAEMNRNSFEVNMTNIILDEIRYIEHKSNKPEINTSQYGDIWYNFQKALDKENCSFWGRLYEDIFNNNFRMDVTLLTKRIHVPKEIREMGVYSVGMYLEELEKRGTKRLNEARIIILGNKGSGKTCIARRLIDPEAPMTSKDESTAGVETTSWELEEDDMNVRIWDFAGHTVTHAVHQFFLSERCLYLIVYNGRTEDNNRLNYWLDHMKNYGGNSKAIILVNLKDKHSPDIPENTLMEKYPIEAFYYFSIQDHKDSLNAFRKKVADYIVNNPSWNKQALPINYYHVKEELEEVFDKKSEAKGEEHITKRRFDEIAEKYDIKDTDQLLRDLHDLGIGLWYQDMEDYDTLVLNPEWISHGVYKIINWVHEAGRHAVSLDDFKSIFKDNNERYPEEKHPFLFELMQHYKLAYPTRDKNTLIIPHLLNEDRPKTLPEFPVGESLMMRYKSEQPLPPHTISRFIVEHNKEIKQENRKDVVWRYGVVLKDGKGSTALVREEDRTISVSVKGKSKTDYLSKLRETLNEIFNSYRSEKPELQYRIERFGQILPHVEEDYPLWLPDRKIVNHQKRQKPYYDDVTNKDIPLERAIKNYKIEAKYLILEGHGHKMFDHSTYNTFNFKDCNINLQSNLNELAQRLKEKGSNAEAEELEGAARALEETEGVENKEELKKKEVLSRLSRIAVDLGNPESILYKQVSGVKHGLKIASDIVKAYNDVVGWVG